MVVGCLGELGEQVDSAWIGALVVGEAELLDLGDLLGALVGSGECEEGHGVDALVEADALSEEADRILPEKAIEDGHLTNLRFVSTYFNHVQV